MDNILLKLQIKARPCEGPDHAKEECEDCKKVICWVCDTCDCSHWRCYSCGSREGFYGGEDFVRCNSCESEHTFPDGEGEPQCEKCDADGWWCEACKLCTCEECFAVFVTGEYEPEEYLCKECLV